MWTSKLDVSSLAHIHHNTHYTKRLAERSVALICTVYIVQCYVACAVARCVVLSALALLCCITSLIAREAAVHDICMDVLLLSNFVMFIILSTDSNPVTLKSSYFNTVFKNNESKM